MFLWFLFLVWPLFLQHRPLRRVPRVDTPGLRCSEFQPDYTSTPEIEVSLLLVSFSLLFLSNFLDLGFFLVNFFFYLVLPRIRRYRAVSRAFKLVRGSVCWRRMRSRRLVSFFWWFFPLLASFSVSLSRTWLLFSLDLVSFVSSFSFSGLGGWRLCMGYRSGNTCELWLRHCYHVRGCCCWGRC